MKECLALRKPLKGERAMIMIEYRKYRKTIPAAIDLLQNRRIAGVERWCMGWFLILGQMVAGAEEIRVFFARDGWLTSLNNRLIYCRMEGLGWLRRGPLWLSQPAAANIFHPSSPRLQQRRIHRVIMEST
jgi:hypothetical protein